MKGKREAAAQKRGGGAGATGGSKQDANTEQLRKISKKLGNAQVQTLIGRNDKARDAIYQFIVQRLQRIRAVQAREKEAMNKQRVWFDEVARKKAGFALPDPTRWRQAAKYYRLAAQSVARGNLGQAVQHMDRAMEAERQAFENLPKQVALDHTETGAVEAPSEMVAVSEGEGCTPREVTEAVNLAETIERESDTSQAAGVRGGRKPWWGEVEEEGEEKKDGAKKGKKGEEKVEAEPEKKPEEGEKKEEEEEVAQAEEKAEEKAQGQEQAVVAAGGVPLVSELPGPPVKTVRTRVKRG